MQFSRDTSGHSRSLGVRRPAANVQVSGHFRVPLDTSGSVRAHMTGWLGVKRSWVRIPPARQKTCSEGMFFMGVLTSASGENKLRTSRVLKAPVGSESGPDSGQRRANEVTVSVRW